MSCSSVSCPLRIRGTLSQVLTIFAIDVSRGRTLPRFGRWAWFEDECIRPSGLPHVARRIESSGTEMQYVSVDISVGLLI